MPCEVSMEVVAGLDKFFFCMFSLNYVHLLMHRVFRRKATCTDYLARPSFLLSALPSVHQFSEVTVLNRTLL